MYYTTFVVRTQEYDALTTDELSDVPLSIHDNIILYTEFV